MWYLIYAIVPSGRAGAVIRAAEQAGSQGGTVIHGKGIGNIPKRFLNFDVEPMREIIWIIVEKEHYQAVSQEIHEKMDLNKSENGILFVEPLNSVHGLVN